MCVAAAGEASCSYIKLKRRSVCVCERSSWQLLHSLHACTSGIYTPTGTHHTVLTSVLLSLCRCCPLFSTWIAPRPSACALCPLQEILDVEQVTEESQGMELNGENVDQVRGCLEGVVVWWVWL